MVEATLPRTKPNISLPQTITITANTINETNKTVQTKPLTVTKEALKWNRKIIVKSFMTEAEVI